MFTPRSLESATYDNRPDSLLNARTPCESDIFTDAFNSIQAVYVTIVVGTVVSTDVHLLKALIPD